MNFIDRLNARFHRLEMKPANEARTSEPEEKLRRVYVWDLVVRLTHWLIALSIFTLSYTGYFIGNPSVESPGEAGFLNTMGSYRLVHFYGAIVFTLSVLVRVYWMFFGSAPARWPNFLPVTKKRLGDTKETLKFYLFMRKTYPPALSHNPMAGLTYLAVFGIYFLIIFTGLGLYGASASDSWLGFFAFFTEVFGGPQWARWIHHAGMWLLLAFFVHHFYSAVLASSIEKNGTLESIFTGYKWAPEHDIDQAGMEGKDADGKPTSEHKGETK